MYMYSCVLRLAALLLSVWGGKKEREVEAVGVSLEGDIAQGRPRAVLSGVEDPDIDFCCVVATWWFRVPRLDVVVVVIGMGDGCPETHCLKATVTVLAL
ncbi:hypothetical protein E2C01_056087 [Portunus trituberculatus]|uniref:Secreted protein n=1 Tax=Portunus trituberculatus TaxID=210409 RepID=A0A5B7GYP7_PORTR|nr:hypothetical protein [Portunus trituberculatus]